MFRVFSHWPELLPGVWRSKQIAREGLNAMGQLTLGLEETLDNVVGSIISIKTEIIMRCPGAILCKSSIFWTGFPNKYSDCKGFSNGFISQLHSGESQWTDLGERA